MRFKKVWLLCLLANVIALGSGCSTTHPAIGKTFNPAASSVCKCDKFPANCKIPLEHFTFVFEVKQLGAEYQITGKALVKEEFQTSNSMGNATFTFLLGKGGVINEAIQASTYKGDLRTGIPFDAKFTPKNPFDALLVGYNVQYHQ